MKYKIKLINFMTVIFIATQVIIGFGLFKQNEMDYLYEVVAIVILVLLGTFLEIKYDFYINNYTRLIVMLTLILHTSVGDYLKLYTTSFIFDKFLHVLGTYAFTLLIYSVLLKLTKTKGPQRVYDFIFILVLGMALGQCFEFLEFSIDIFLKPSNPAQESLIDTDIDLIANTIGAFLAAIHFKLRKFKPYN